jgi:hypothetical protein
VSYQLLLLLLLLAGMLLLLLLLLSPDMLHMLLEQLPNCCLFGPVSTKVSPLAEKQQPVKAVGYLLPHSCFHS